MAPDVDVSGVISSALLSIPPTVAALLAYRKSNHTARKIGDVPRREVRRIARSDNFKGKRSGDNTIGEGTGQGLSLNTILGIIHADVIDVRDEVQENTKLTNQTREEMGKVADRVWALEHQPKRR